MSSRLIELVDRLIAPGPKAAQLSASECHEIADEVHELLDQRRGREAEELRSALEKLTAECASSDSSEVREVAEDMRRLLDEVDARDSLAHLEAFKTFREASRHLAHVEVDFESARRGGSTRAAACLCGWKGPQRGTLKLVVDDALTHERIMEAHASWKKIIDPKGKDGHG